MIYYLDLHIDTHIMMMIQLLLLMKIQNLNQEDIYHMPGLFIQDED